MNATPKQLQRWNVATRAAMGAGLIGSFLLIPLNLHANIFTSLTGGVSQIASIEKKVATTQSAISKYDTTVVAPVGQLNAVRGWLSRSDNQYQNWFGSVDRLRVPSATLPAASSFEHDLLAGTNGGDGAPVAGAFSSVYGARLPLKTTSTATAQSVDMADASAEQGMTLAANSDSAAASLIGSAQKLQQSAGGSTPGTAGIIAAEAAALNLHAQAMQQHVLAALIRQQAGELAGQTAAIKSATTAHQNALTTLTSGAN